MNTTIQTLKGFRDFLPEENSKREYIRAIIAQVFKTFGFESLETPTLEYASLLLGKYGDEADKLVFTFEDQGGRKVGLRYDQTVPTARVLAQYQHLLPKTFRRYQMQNVFRADKPQKGRFREFTQCDADIFGISTTTADAEILAVFYSIFNAIGFSGVTIAINDRETLINALTPFANTTVSVFSLIQSIDKLDKLTPDQVIAELEKKGLNSQSAKSAVKNVMSTSASDNLKAISETAINLGVDPKALKFEPTLARGLDYYTGLIFEAKITGYTVGSVGGGGRYDRLIGDLSGLNIPAVGFGLGFDRTVEAAFELGLIPTNGQQPTVLVTCFSIDQIAYAASITHTLRQKNIATELYPDPEAKIAKQFKAADQKNIPFVIVIGQNELEKQMVTLKNMATGEQKLISIDEAIASLTD